MLKSYIITDTSLSVVWVGRKPTTIPASHPKFSEITSLLVSGLPKDVVGEKVSGLLNVADVIKEAIAKAAVSDSLTIDIVGRRLLYRGEQLKHVVETVVFNTIDRGGNIKPIVQFMERLLKNPSKHAIAELYRWIEVNKFVLTEDGCFLAYKRVRDDYTSFYDCTTHHTIGGTLEMPRNEVDGDCDATCSSGLHFCSRNYLPHYAGKQGRVLILKIDPMDVVAIPSDYNLAKGRACRYTVLGELSEINRNTVEEREVMRESQVSTKTVVDEINSVTDDFVSGYRLGYRNGRGKKAHLYRNEQDVTAYADGYRAGFIDGKAKGVHRFPVVVS